MSDRMTNTDIEDVLSSIRRLVSEEARFPFRSERREPQPEPAGKLMLTPDIRVVPDQRAEAPAPVAGAAAETEAGGEVRQAEAPTPAPDAPAAGPMVAQFHRAVRGEPISKALGDRAAVLEAALSSGNQDFEPDGSEVKPSAYLSSTLPEPGEPAPDASEAAAGPAPGEVAETHAAAEPVVETEREAPEVAEAAPPAGSAAEAEPQPVEAEAGEPDAGETESAPEDAEGESEDMRTGFVFGWRDEIVPKFSHRSEAEEPSLFNEPEVEELDEEALREMIREMIREELQGALGERLTRNVRKLVRMEISRALAGRDLG